MNDITATVSKLTASSKGILSFSSKHRILLVVLISSTAVMMALLQTRTYMNPVRDEATYTELSTGINYQGIDNEVVEKLQSTQSDEDIQVDANLVPDRSNPFNE